MTGLTSSSNVLQPGKIKCRVLSEKSIALIKSPKMSLRQVKTPSRHVVFVNMYCTHFRSLIPGRCARARCVGDIWGSRNVTRLHVRGNMSAVVGVGTNPSLNGNHHGACLTCADLPLYATAEVTSKFQEEFG